MLVLFVILYFYGFISSCHGNSSESQEVMHVDNDLPEKEKYSLKSPVRKVCNTLQSLKTYLTTARILLFLDQLFQLWETLKASWLYKVRKTKKKTSTSH